MTLRALVGRVRRSARRRLRNLRVPIDGVWYRIAVAVLHRRTRPTATTALVTHLYYADTWPLLAESLRRLRVPHDVFVSLPIRNVPLIRQVRRAFPGVRFMVVPNRGRDVLPFVAIASVLLRRRYDVVLKIHSKRSPHFEGGRAWLELLLDRLVPGPDVVDDLIRRLRQPDAGVVGPSELYVPLVTYLRENRAHLAHILTGIVGRESAQQVLGNPEGYGFFAGTMFWARLDAIRPLLGFGPRDFEAEAGQADGTLAHALERAFTLIPCLLGRENLEFSDGGMRPRPTAASGGPHSWFGLEVDR